MSFEVFQFSFYVNLQRIIMKFIYNSQFKNEKLYNSRMDPMTVNIQKQSKNNEHMLSKIKRNHLIKRITMIVCIVFLLFVVISLLQGFKNNLSKDIIGATINLIFAWNFGLLLFVGVWKLSHIEKINKQLISELTQLLSDSKRECDEQIEVAINDLMNKTNVQHNIKYNKLKRFCLISLIISFVIVMITLIFEFV